MVDLAVKLNWDYVSLVLSSDQASQSAGQAIKEFAAAKRICIREFQLESGIKERLHEEDNPNGVFYLASTPPGKNGFSFKWIASLRQCLVYRVVHGLPYEEGYSMGGSLDKSHNLALLSRIHSNIEASILLDWIRF